MDSGGPVRRRRGGGEELGPDVGERRLEVDLTPVGEQMQTGGGGRFRAGEHGDERVGLPVGGRAILTRRGDRTAPQIDDSFTVDHHHDGGAELAPLGEVALELAPHRSEVWVVGSVHGDRVGVGRTVIGAHGRTLLDRTRSLQPVTMGTSMLVLAARSGDA
ncbi:MAG: hypothetical protein R2710_00585 [Acidimicrobiales bacterium]